MCCRKRKRQVLKEDLTKKPKDSPNNSTRSSDERLHKLYEVCKHIHYLCMCLWLGTKKQCLISLIVHDVGIHCYMFFSKVMALVSRLPVGASITRDETIWRYIDTVSIRRLTIRIVAQRDISRYDHDIRNQGKSPRCLYFLYLTSFSYSFKKYIII